MTLRFKSTVARLSKNMDVLAKNDLFKMRFHGIVFRGIVYYPMACLLSWPAAGPFPMLP